MSIHNLMTYRVPMRFGDPRYLVLFLNGALATSIEITDEIKELLLNGEIILVDLQEMGEISAEGEIISIQDMDDLTEEQKSPTEGDEE